MKAPAACRVKVRNVEVLSGHRLALEFSDGTSGIADLSQHVKRAPFQALSDERAFREARVEHGAVEWPSAEVGIATEALYALAVRRARLQTLSPAEPAAHLTPGQAVRITREFAALSQVDLAKCAGLSHDTLLAIETGRATLDAEQARRLARALKVHPGALLFPDWTE